MIDKYINNIIQGDCLEIMRGIPDNSVDVTFANPPFNLKKKYNGYKDIDFAEIKPKPRFKLTDEKLFRFAGNLKRTAYK